MKVITGVGREFEYFPVETHTADSQWQSCNCMSCQEKRRLIDSAPSEKGPIDFKTYRRKDEKY